MKIKITLDYRTENTKDIKKDFLIFEYDNKKEELDMSSESIEKIESLNDFILENILEHEIEIDIKKEEDNTVNWEIANTIKEIYKNEIEAIKKDLSSFKIENGNDDSEIYDK